MNDEMDNAMEEKIEQLRESAHRIQNALDEFMSNGIPRRTLLLLIRDKTGLGFGDIGRVLDALTTLDEYLYEDVDV